jgi:hypothetical protein
MLRQEFRLRLDRFGKLCGQHLGNVLVVLLPGALEQRLIRCLLEQGMLERIRGLWRYPRG